MRTIWTLLVVSVCAVVGQYSDFDSPLPPRPVIPGAVPVGGGGGAVRRPLVRGGGRRVQQVLEEPLPVARARRPGPGAIRASRIQNALPAPLPQPIAQSQPVLEPAPSPVALPPRPVVEDLEELLHVDDVNPTTLPPPIKLAPQPAPEPTPSFRPQILRPQPSQEDFPVPNRQQFRNFVSDAEPAQFSPKRPAIEQPVARPRPVERVRSEPRFRPAPAEQRQSRPEQRVQPQSPPPRQQQYNRQQQVVTRPEKDEYEKSVAPPKRGRKPTVEVLRKYREDNPDGSITWGFENDDGTYKEETIGVDCITRGKYGYFDPEGVRREFTYTSGIPCDKDKDAPEDPQQTDKGYIDYSNNRYVLPNGDSVDINSMVKNRARKPSLRN